MSSRVVSKLVYNSIVLGYRYLLDGRYVDVSEDKVRKYAVNLPNVDTLWYTMITNDKYKPTVSSKNVTLSKVYTSDEVNRHYRAEDISSDHQQLVYLFNSLGVLRPEFVYIGLTYDMYWSEFMSSPTIKVTELNDWSSVVSTVIGGYEVVDRAMMSKKEQSTDLKLHHHSSILLSGFKRGFLLSSAVLEDYPVLYYANKALSSLKNYLRVSLNGIIEYKQVENYQSSGITVYELSSLSDDEKVNFLKAIGLSDFYEVYAILVDFNRKVRCFEGLDASRFPIGNDDMMLALVNRVLHESSFDILEKN